VFCVFSQLAGAAPPYEQLAAHAARFFATTLERISEGEESVQLAVRGERPQFAQVFTIRVRGTSADDRASAATAEARGRAHGMSELAARCPSLWELEPTPPLGPKYDLATLTLCAICASVALGPVLPPDHSTLFGVRGAIERRDLIARS
jgi:hypothetical protein